MTTMAVPFDGTITKTQQAPTIGGMQKTAVAPKPGYQPANVPFANGQVPSWVDPKAAAANPQGFQSWMQRGQAAGAFSPQQNLIGSQFNPMASQRTIGVQQAMNIPGLFQRALGQATPQAPGLSQQTGDLRSLLARQAQGLEGNTPDRAKLAADTYGLLVERSEPQFQQGLRSIGQKAAALGRVGSGLTTNELTDFGTLRERGLDQSRRQLATESAGLTLSDALDRLQGVGNAAGLLGSQDIAVGGLGLQAQGQGFNNLLGLARFGSDYERGLADEDFRGRQEYRGERDYQYGLERDALGDRERQFGMEEAARQQAFNRDLARAQLGYGTNPAGAYSAAGQQMGNQAQSNLDIYGPLFSEWARSRNRRPAGGTEGGPVYTEAPDYTDQSGYAY